MDNGFGEDDGQNAIKVYESEASSVSDELEPYVNEICEQAIGFGGATGTDDSDQIDKKLEQTLRDIEEVDTFIQKLNERKSGLIKEYDRLKEVKMRLKSKALETGNWNEETFDWSTDIRKILKDTFKLKDFRSQQLQAINAILSKHDVILLAPTGGGKSLCYQLPAIYMTGLTLVISPLIALMQNQIWSLQKLGIDAEMLDQSTDRVKNNAILKMMTEGKNHCNLKLLYVTPERLAKSKRFMSALQKSYFASKLSMIAVDEVHCCSSWGHDFRPDYKFLGSLKSMFPSVPILGVTATATSNVIDDVQKMLNLQDCLVLRAPFNRPNLFYHVMEKPSEKEEQYKLITHLALERFKNQTGIIYTFSTNDAEDLARELTTRGVKARPYHARMMSDRRDKVLTKWLTGEIHTVVATIAFGMGIDKPDVRYVIHHTISKSMENFYQESGRAGRDGKRAECILLFRFADMSRITSMMFTEKTGLENAYSMIDYCIDGSRCRRDLIAKHFTEVWSDLDCNQMCDHCYHRKRVRPPMLDLRSYCASLYTIIDNAAQTDAKLTGAKLVDAWFHKGAALHRCPAVSPPAIDRYFAEQIVAHLITNKYLKEDFHFTAYATISYIRRGPLNGAKASKSIDFQCARVLSLPNGKTSASPPPTTDDDEDDVEFVWEDVSQRKTKKKKKSKIDDSRRKSTKSTPGQSLQKDSSEKRKKRQRELFSTSDSMVLERRLLDFKDELFSDDAESMRTAQHMTKVAKVVAKEKKRRRLAEQRRQYVDVPIDVGEISIIPKIDEVIDIDSS